MYEIELDTESLKTIYAPPEGKRIVSVSEMENDQIAIVFKDEIHIHKANIELAGEVVEYESKEKSDYSIALPGERLRTIPLPEDIRGFVRFSFAEIPGEETVVFKCQSGPMTADIVRFVRMRTDGTVIQSRDVPSITSTQRSIDVIAALCGLGACAPFLLGLFAAVVDAVVQTINGTGPGLMLRLFTSNVPFAISIFGTMLACSLLAAWLARRTADHYGFKQTERRWWIGLAFAFGPAGLLTLWSLRHWPAKLPCPACNEPQPVDLVGCLSCETTREPTSRDGTEIFEPVSA